MSDQAIYLHTGQNTSLIRSSQLEVIVQCEAAPGALDVSCFMVNEAGKVPSDDYFVFYNQNTDPHDSVHLKHMTERNSLFALNMDKLQQAPIEKCVFTATLDGAGTFANVQGCQAIVRIGSQQITYVITEATAETAIIFLEIYRYRDWFKVRAIGRGFFGGLKPLAESYGVVIEGEESAPSPAVTAVNTPGIPTSGASTTQPQPNVPPTKIDLLKRKVNLSLTKKQVSSIQARVAVVFDASASMFHLYRRGVMQQAFERILAISAAFDDNGELDVWFFADSYLRAPSVTPRDYEDYISRNYTLGSYGYLNNEPPVMEDVIRNYTIEEPNDKIPTYIIFFSDGGVGNKKEITKLITESSSKNLFWQFVGLGRADYGILKKLDKLRGRFIDNANFFELDDISRVSDENLYDRLLNEFPSWITEARRKGILTEN